MTVGVTYSVTHSNLLAGPLALSSIILIYPQLRNVTLLLFKLNGTEFDIIYTGEPVGRQVRYSPGGGTFKFENPVTLHEKIYALYRY